MDLAALERLLPRPRVDPRTLKRGPDEDAWRFLVRVLETCGPLTTGQLGHVYGIGQNVRGIKREADVGLSSDRVIISYETWVKNPDTGLPMYVSWATYELVPATEAEAVLAMHRRIGATNRQVLGAYRQRRKAASAELHRAHRRVDRPVVPALPGLGPGPRPKQAQGVLL
jgi:hypothetical protein